MTQLTELDIGDALDAVLLDFTGGGDINTEGTLYQPQAGRPYLSSQLVAYVRMPLGIGPDTGYEARGTYKVNVNRPAAEGARMARAVAARLVATFPRGMAVPFSTVLGLEHGGELLLASGAFLALGTGPALTVEYASEQPVIAEGDWLTVPVVVSWFCTE